MTDFGDGRTTVGGDGILNRPPNVSEIEAALARLLKSERFARNGNAARFLKFVVEETLAGRGDRLKAYTIATLALGRPDDFDPQADSIVRVQAARVRSQVEEYYASHGAGESLRIELAKGSYQPTFTWMRASPVTPIDANVPKAVEEPSPQKPAFRRRTFEIAVAVLVAVVVSAISIAWPWRANFAAENARRTPVLAVLATDAPNAGASVDAATERLMAEIETVASTGDYVQLRRQSNASARIDYQLEVRFSGLKSDSFDVGFTLVYVSSGDVVWSTQHFGVDANDFSALDALASMVAAEVSDFGGALLADVYKRFEQDRAPLIGLYCELSALDYIRAGRQDGRSAARACLEKQVALAPDDAPTLSLLSTLLVLDYFDMTGGSLGEPDVQRAMQLARHAYDLNPRRLNSRAALFFSSFADKRYEDAFEFASSLQGSDRDAVLIQLRLGRAYVSRACYNEGAGMLERVEATLHAPQPTATEFLSLAAFMRGDEAAVRRYTKRGVSHLTPIGLLLGMIACHHSGDTECVDSLRETLKVGFPGVFSDMRATFDRYGLAPDIVDRLEAELPALGLVIQQSVQGRNKEVSLQPSFCRS